LSELEDELRGDQAMAFEAIKIFLQQPRGGMFLLDGYAGTGKTYLMDYVVRHIQDETRMPIIITAPTHKAVRVLRNHVSTDVAFATIHSALALRENIDGYGVITFIRDPRVRCKLYDVQFVVVDEASMLPDEVYDELLIFREQGLKILFVGDSVQIPPVNQPDALPFDKQIRQSDGMGYIKMEEIIRQDEGSPIIDHSFKIRQFIHRPIPVINRVSKKTKQGKLGFIKFQDLDEFLCDFILPMFKTEEFEKDPDFVKLLAWRNTTVDKYNKLIRQHIYEQKDLAKILPGEKLVATEPFFYDDMIIIHNNEEMEVLDFTIEKEDLEEYDIKYYNTKVAVARDWDPYSEHYIRIIHEDSEKEWRDLLNLLKQYALSKKQGTFEAKSAWIDYYSFKKKFHDVKYNYAITCHKSQGSTYNTAVVLEQDIDTNRNTFEKNRVFYTACTRPSKNLYVIY